MGHGCAVVDTVTNGFRLVAYLALSLAVDAHPFEGAVPVDVGQSHLPGSVGTLAEIANAVGRACAHDGAAYLSSSGTRLMNEFR
jgi:hypothetical protein